MKRLVWVGASFVLAVALLTGIVALLSMDYQPAAAAITAEKTFVVTIDDDPETFHGGCSSGGLCSLRGALAAAKAEPGNEPVTITFDVSVSTITFEQLSHLVGRISNGPLYIDGDRNNDGVPDVTIQWDESIVLGPEDNLIAFSIQGNYVTIDGLRIQGFLDNAAVAISADNTIIKHTEIISNRWGLWFKDDAENALITATILANNSRGAVFSADKADGANPAHDNVIADSYIGTDSSGAQLGNERGVVIQRGSYNNVIRDCEIAYNDAYAIYIYGGGGSDEVLTDTLGNEIRHNNIYSNASQLTFAPYAAIVNQRTHVDVGRMPSVSGGYDNLYINNTITDNAGISIYNMGASPLITGNVIMNNTGSGIENQPDFMGTYDPADAADDLLSIPVIVNNQISGNGNYGIYSLDTAPVDRYQLHQLNTIGANTREQVLQSWYGVVEALTGTLVNPEPMSTSVVSQARILGQSGLIYSLPDYDEVAPSGSLTHTSGIWASQDVNYEDVSTWRVIREYYVLNNVLVNEVTYTAQVLYQGMYLGDMSYSFDGLTTTHPVFNDMGLPQWIETGPFGRYQIAEVNFILDSDGDGIPDSIEGDDDIDGDGTPDYLDNDDDADSDGISDADEGFDDIDGDGVPNYLDTDADGDGVDDTSEGTDDTDGDGTPDYLDSDDDGDGLDTDHEGADPNGDGNPDDAIDTDGDGTPDYLDSDDDGDGLDTDHEGADPNGDGNPDDAIDTDGDGTPDYLDNDDDGDGLDTDHEGADPNGDGNPDDAIDTDGDGTPDYLDNDDDGDGLDTDHEGADPNGDGNPDDAIDTDGDGTPDYLDNDDDGDGLDTDQEGADPNGDGNPDDAVDTDGDGTPDYLDDDDDGDGLNTDQEGADPNGDGNPDDAIDTDGDGTPDYLDDDDDDDGVPTAQEGVDPNGDGNPDDAIDTNGDGTADYLDDDDDGDGVATEDEAVTCTPDAGNPDTDGCVCDGDACYVDTDNDGKADYKDPDDDGDSVATADELEVCTPDAANEGTDNCACVGDTCSVDTNNDGTPDFADPDDDGDSVHTEYEAVTCTPDAANPDTDGCFCDGDACYVDTDDDDTPDYKDLDDDGDSVYTIYETGDCQEDDPKCVCEGGNCYQDTDNDGTPDYLDDDDDDDGILTINEQPDLNVDGDPEDAVDTDDDGTPDYLDPDVVDTGYWLYLPITWRNSES